MRLPARVGWLDAAVRNSAVHAGWAIASWGVLTLAAAFAVLELPVDTTIGSALDRSDVAWGVYQRSLALYGGDEFVTVAIHGEEPFDPKALKSLLDLTRQFEEMPEVRRVDSLASVPIIRAAADGTLLLDAALTPEVFESQESMNEFVQSVRGDRIAPRSLVSADEKTFALNLIFTADVDGDREQPVARVRRILKGQKGQPAQISGVPVVRADAGERTRTELATFVPITALLLGAVLLAAFRSWSAVFAPLVSSGVGTILCLGLMSVAGGTLSITTLLLPSVLLAVGCAYSMHVLTAACGLRTAKDIGEAAASAARAIALSGLTTSIGFLAMATVHIELIRQLAAFGAAGVLLVTAASLTLVPALLSVWPLGRESGSGIVDWIRGPLRRSLMGFIDKRRRWVVGSWAALLVALASGLSLVKVSSDVILWFPSGSELRQDYEGIRKSLSGITPVNILVESESGDSITDPRVVSAIDALTEALGDLPQVGKALSVSDPLRQMHSVVLGQRDVGLPRESGIIEQYLLLLSGVDRMGDVIASDHQGANVLVRLNENASEAIASLGRWVERWWRENGVPGFRVRTTGIMYEFARSQDEIAYGGLRGLSLALITVGVLLSIMLRHGRLALLASIPNAAPVGMAFGFMGLVGIPVDAATVCLGSLALGLAVDDTIHVVMAYREARQAGYGKRESLDRCFRQVLPAVVLTTVATAIGFGVLGFSGFSLVRNLGLMTAGVVAVCLLADLLLLPCLLLQSRDELGNAKPQ